MSAFGDQSRAAMAAADIRDRESDAEGAAPESAASRFTFLEFFAGGGTARLGLGDGWTCLMANDCDALKAETYRRNFGGGAELVESDVRAIRAAGVPGPADLAWASFPCQDLSSAGARKGLDGASSGAFWPFWEIIRGLAAEGRAPGTVVLENVTGLLSSGGCRDFREIVGALTAAGYRTGALCVDAGLFLPHSRKRIFVVAVSGAVALPASLADREPSPGWTPAALLKAVAAMPPTIRDAWVWWRMPPPDRTPCALTQLLDADAAVRWHRPDVTDGVLSMLGHHDSVRLAGAKAVGGPVYGSVTIRTRLDEAAGKARRANLAFGGPLPCILIPKSGVLPRSMLIRVEGEAVRTRALTPAEGARFMGIPPGYVLPGNYGKAFRILGDAVVVPVVAHLARHLLEPLASAARATGTALPSRRPGTEADGDVRPREPHPLPAQARARKGNGRPADGRDTGRGIKGCTKTTLYLLPDEHRRLKQLALDRDVPLHTLVQDGLDRELAYAGRRPLRRYSAEER